MKKKLITILVLFTALALLLSCKKMPDAENVKISAITVSSTLKDKANRYRKTTN